jgi:hypothetical protein
LLLAVQFAVSFANMTVPAHKRIHHRAKVSDTESHDDDADVVKSAFEKIYEHLASLSESAVNCGSNG